MPKSVADLFETVRARKIAIALGFEKMTLKESTWDAILSTVQIHLILKVVYLRIY